MFVESYLMRSVSWLVLIFLFICTGATAGNFGGAPNLSSGLPLNTRLTKLGDEIYLNGMPAEIIGIAVPASIKDTAVFFANRWASEGWKVSVERAGDLVLVMSVNDVYHRVASLSKTGDASTEGSLSLTDIPLRLKNGGGLKLPVGEHLLKPTNTSVLNEVRIRDQTGETIFTTVVNSYSVEQNAAFYQERMVEQGWKETKHKTVEVGKSAILVFAQARKQATFTIMRQNEQSLITVNWVSQ